MAKKSRLPPKKRPGPRGLVSAASAYGVRKTVPVPRLISTPRGTVVSNSESILTLTASATANTPVTGRIDLSVRNATSLPWLATVGELYSKYRVNKLSVCYEPYCSTTLGGEVAAVIVYDQNDDTAISAASILQTAGNERTPVWSPTNAIVYDKSRAAYPWLYSKVNPAATTLANLSVAGWLTFSYFSSTAGAALGRFMCHYTVEFVDPIAPGLNG